MAITKTMHMKASAKGKIDIHLEHALNYIMQPKKLGKANLVGGVNCLPEMACEQMKRQRRCLERLVADKVIILLFL